MIDTFLSIVVTILLYSHTYPIASCCKLQINTLKSIFKNTRLRNKIPSAKVKMRERTIEVNIRKCLWLKMEGSWKSLNETSGCILSSLFLSLSKPSLPHGATASHCRPQNGAGPSARPRKNSWSRRKLTEDQKGRTCYKARWNPSRLVTRERKSAQSQHKGIGWWGQWLVWVGRQWLVWGGGQWLVW